MMETRNDTQYFKTEPYAELSASMADELFSRLSQSDKENIIRSIKSLLSER